MFSELEKYKYSDQFFFNQLNDLKSVCNAPINKSEFYIVYALTNGRVELVYMGRLGKFLIDGKMFVKKSRTWWDKGTEL